MATKENQEVKLTTMFLDFQGIPGETRNKAYKDQMEITGISHKIGYPTSLGDIPPSEKDSFSFELELVHQVFIVEFDLAYKNLLLLNYQWELRPIDMAILTILESDVEMLKMEFKNIRIREFTISLNDGTLSDTGKESSYGRMAFSYEAVQYVYTSTNEQFRNQGQAVAEIKIPDFDHSESSLWERNSAKHNIQQKDSTRDSTGSDRNYAAKTPSPFTPKEPEAKKEREKRDLIRAAKGPAKAEFGARVKNRETGNFDIKTYRYRLTNFPGDMTKAERESLKDLQWGVRIGKEGAFKPLDDQQGIEIDLAIEYEHATRTIYVGPMIEGTVPEHLQVETTIPFTVPLVPEIMIRKSEKESDPRKKFINAVKLQHIWFNTPEKSIFYDGQKDITKQFFNNTIITLAWIKSYKRGMSMYKRFINPAYWFSRNFKRALFGKFIKHDLLGKDVDVPFYGFPSDKIVNGKREKVDPCEHFPDPNKEMLLLNDCYEQHLPWKWTQKDPNDDLKATLANCDWRMVPEGVIKPRDSRGRQLVKITRCAIFVRDSFDYVGSQFGELGDWSVHPPDLAFESWSGDYTDVSNKMYRAWRKKYEIGHDFLVFSDVEYLKPENIAFYIVESTTLTGEKYLEVEHIPTDATLNSI